MLLALSVLACTNTTSPEFGGGGERYTSGEYGVGGGSGTTGDTSDTAGDTGTGDTGYKLEAGAPVLGGVTLVMATDALQVTYVLGEVGLTDAEGDVVGGRLYLDWYPTSESASLDERTVSIAAKADATATEYAYARDTSLVFYASGLNPTLEYQFLMQVVDGSGHTSNVVTGTVGPL